MRCSSGSGKVCIPTGAIVLVLNWPWHVFPPSREVGNVRLAPHGGLVGRRQLHRKHGLPIKIGSLVPQVLLDVLDAARPAWQALAGILLEKGSNQLLRVAVACWGEDKALHAPQNFGVDLHRRRRLERRMPGQELELKDAQRPPIHRAAVASGLDDFWRKVVGSSTRCEGLADHELREAHVGQLYVAFRREEEILRLQVAVDDAALMQMLEGVDHTSNVVPGMLFTAVEATASVGSVEFPSQSGLQEEVQVLGAVVRRVELDEEIGVGHHQNVLLIHHSILHPGLRDEALAKSLQGIGVTSLLVLPKLDSAEAAAAKQANLLQVLFGDLLSLPNSILCCTSFVSMTSSSLLSRVQDVLQRTQQHVEGITVQSQHLCCARGH
mmetsp:Transcript_6142/g.14256  ORF Transcript_6142/g.14256 Transcript_6142/m.14256 type:complete len:381 (-) Transcript_6142:1299-2441(-)